MPVVELELDASGAVKGLKQFDDASDRSVKSMGSLRAGVNSFGTQLLGLDNILGTVTKTIQLGGAAAVGFAGYSIKAASDLEETQGKFDVVFGKFDQGFQGLIEQSEAWAENLNENYGLSEEASKRYLSSIQDLIVPTGLARDVSADLSNKFVKLAVDLASFNNKANADVIADFQSALSGSAETMVKYGIDIKKTAVEQEALRLGLIKAGQELDRQASVQAIYSIAMRESADAVGDFERTSGGLANQQKITIKLFQDFSATVGSELLPVATEAITALNTWAQTEGNLESVIVGSIEVLRFMSNAIDGVVLAFQGATFIWLNAAEILTYLLKPLEWVIDGLNALGVIEIDTNPIAGLRAEIVGLQEETANAMIDQWGKIEQTNKSFDNLAAKYDQVAASGEGSASRQVAAQGAVQQAAEKTSKILSQPGASIGEVNPKAFTDLAELERNLTLNIDKSGVLATTWEMVNGVWVETLGNGQQVVDGMVIKVDELTNSAALNKAEIENLNGVWVQTGETLNNAVEPAKSEIDLLKESIIGAGVEAQSFNSKLADLAQLDKSASALKEEIKGIEEEFKAGLVTQDQYVEKFEQLTVAEIALGNIQNEISLVNDELRKGSEEAQKFAETQRDLAELDGKVRGLGDSYAALKDSAASVADSTGGFANSLNKLSGLDAQARSLQEEINALDAAIGSGTLSTKELRERFEQLTTANLALESVQNEISLVNDELRKGSEEAQRFAETQRDLAELDGKVRGMGDEYSGLKDEILKSSEAARGFNANIGEIGKLDAQARALRDEISVLRNAIDSGTLSADDLRDRFEQLTVAELALSKVEDQMSSLTEQIKAGTKATEDFGSAQQSAAQGGLGSSSSGSYSFTVDNSPEGIDDRINSLQRTIRELKSIESYTADTSSLEESLRNLLAKKAQMEMENYIKSFERNLLSPGESLPARRQAQEERAQLISQSRMQLTINNNFTQSFTPENAATISAEQARQASYR